MTRSEAKRRAHAAVAALVDVNLYDDSDLFVDFEGLSAADGERVMAAMHEIIAYHRRLGSDTEEGT